jgi:hypothetical protein
MSKYSSLSYSIYHWFAVQAPKISWSKKHRISDEMKDELAKILANGYYIILTGNRSHLSSVLVSLISWFKTGKWARYSHVLMNCDNIENSDERHAFKFVEADVKGVVYTTFDDVFKCDNVCLLSPKLVRNEEWTAIIDALVNQVGKPYDDLFDLADDSRASCVEVVLDALEKANFVTEFQNLREMIEEEGNLIPQMYRDCIDFQVVLER